MKSKLTAVFALSLVTLAACGGGGGGDSGSGAAPVKAASVSGPLDALQDPVSEKIVGPLATALNGTPLQGLVLCVNQLVVEDALDGVDSVVGALKLTNPATALTGLANAANVQNQLQNLVVSLQGTLVALKGDAAGCVNVSAPNGTNPLSGTQFSQAGATLAPVLKTIFDKVTAGGTGGSRPQLSMTELNALFTQLNTAVNTAFGSLPVEVTGAPVLGGVVSTVKLAVSQLATVVASASAGNPTATQAAAATALNQLLKGVLLNVVPLTQLENQTSHAGVISGPLSTAIDNVTALISGGSFGSNPLSTLQTQLSALIGQVVDPEQTNVLNKLLTPLLTALQGVGVTPGTNPLSGLITGLTGFLHNTPLAPILDALGSATCTLPAPLNLLCGL